MSVEENILFCSPEVSFVGAVGPGRLSSTRPKWSRLVRVLMWGGLGWGVVEFRLRVEEGSQPAEQQRTEGGCGG